MGDIRHLTMQIQFIYTFQKSEQLVSEIEIPMEDVLDKENFADLATAILTGEEKAELVKISSCANANKEDLPQWFLDCNGKLWFEDGQLDSN